MGVFDDKKFEQLDWMVQITETIDGDINGLLARLPDRVEFEFSDLAPFIGGYGFNSDNAVRDLLKEANAHTSWEEDSMIASCYEFAMDDWVSIDIKERKLNGTVALIKTTKTFTDEQLLKIMGTRGITRFRKAELGKDCVSRMNEILDILGDSKEVISNKSINKKKAQIGNRLSKIFSTNEWRIRDMNLADKISYWITEYVRRGDLSGLTNLCKVKIMTHNNMPIYSIEEET